MVPFCEELLSENGFEVVLVNFCYDYGANTSEAVQKHKDTGIVRQLTKTANFIATPMKKHI